MTLIIKPPAGAPGSPAIEILTHASGFIVLARISTVKQEDIPHREGWGTPAAPHHYRKQVGLPAAIPGLPLHGPGAPNQISALVFARSIVLQRLMSPVHLKEKERLAFAHGLGASGSQFPGHSFRSVAGSVSMACGKVKHCGRRRQ